MRFKKRSLNFLGRAVHTSTNNFFKDILHNNFRASPSTIRKALLSANIPLTEGYTNYKIQDCLFCLKKPDNSCKSAKDPDIFINKMTGQFLCYKCKKLGKWHTLEKILSSSADSRNLDNYDLIKSECSSFDLSENWKMAIKDCVHLCAMENSEYDLILQGFGLHSCSKEVMSHLDVKFDKKKELLLFPLFSKEIIVGFQMLNASGNITTFPKTDCPGILSFNAHNNSRSSTVVIVSEIKDLLSLAKLNLPYRVVCLPYSCETLPQNVLPLFEGQAKIVLWLGDKFGTWNSTIQFAKKLIEKRCFVVTSKEKQSSALRAVSENVDVKEMIAKARPIWHPFVTTFSSLQGEVLMDIQNYRDIKGVPWARFSALNNILKGHRRGELTVLTGPTGSGKTTFLSEYSLDLAAQGVNTLWGSFEIKNTTLLRIMLQQYSGKNFTADNQELFHHWGAKFEKLPLYFLRFHGQYSLDTVMNAVEHCSYTYDIAHVIIDNVQFMIDVSTEAKHFNRFFTQDCIIQAFRKFSTVYNCHVTLVIHPRKEHDASILNMNSIFGSAKAVQEADNVLIIQCPEPEIMHGKKYLQVCKNRFTGELGNMSMVFDRKTLCFAIGRNKNVPAKAPREDIQETSVHVHEDASQRMYE